MRRDFALAAGIAFAVGLMCLAWPRLGLPGAWFIRGYLGDVVIIVFAASGLAVLRPWPAGWRSAAVLALAVGLEVLQGWRTPDGALGTATGTTQDPYDLLAYALGAGVQILVEWRIRQRRP